MVRRLAFVLLCLALALSGGACGKKKPPEPTASPARAVTTGAPRGTVKAPGDTSGLHVHPDGLYLCLDGAPYPVIGLDSPETKLRDLDPELLRRADAAGVTMLTFFAWGGDVREIFPGARHDRPVPFDRAKVARWAEYVGQWLALGPDHTATIHATEMENARQATAAYWEEFGAFWAGEVQRRGWGRRVILSAGEELPMDPSAGYQLAYDAAAGLRRGMARATGDRRFLPLAVHNALGARGEVALGEEPPTRRLADSRDPEDGGPLYEVFLVQSPPEHAAQHIARILDHARAHGNAVAAIWAEPTPASVGVPEDRHGGASFVNLRLPGVLYAGGSGMWVYSGYDNRAHDLRTTPYVTETHAEALRRIRDLTLEATRARTPFGVAAAKAEPAEARAATAGAYTFRDGLAIVDFADLPAPASWTRETIHGIPALTYRGSDHFPSPAAGDAIMLEFESDAPGEVELLLRNFHWGAAHDDDNDVWMLAPGDKRSPMKVFSNEGTGTHGLWNWHTRWDNDRDRPPVVLRVPRGRFQLTLVGRSHGFAIQRLVLRRRGTSTADPYNLALAPTGSSTAEEPPLLALKPLARPESADTWVDFAAAGLRDATVIDHYPGLNPAQVTATRNGIRIAAPRRAEGVEMATVTWPEAVRLPQLPRRGGEPDLNRPRSVLVRLYITTEADTPAQLGELRLRLNSADNRLNQTVAAVSVEEHPWLPARGETGVVYAIFPTLPDFESLACNLSVDWVHTDAPGKDETKGIVLRALALETVGE